MLSAKLSLLPPLLIFALLPNDLINFFRSSPVLCQSLNLFVDKFRLNEKGLKFLMVDVHVIVFLFKLI
jgi:hypothetical protein